MIRETRLKKLEVLRKESVDLYPATPSFPISEISEIRKNFKKYADSKKSLGAAGRIIARREHGGSVFLDIYSGLEKLQVFLAKDKIGEKFFSLFSETADVGDFIAVFGTAFYTKKKEPTIEAGKLEMLTKSFLPLPEKWHGLRDVEERFRKRYLDILMNPAVREKFLFRSRLISELRNILDKEGYVEVETPILQPIYGGALAEPFKTHHRMLNMDMYLRIAPELYLKRLLAAGFNKVYEIGKNFRNEGLDATHNPEFTTIELYSAYKDAEYLRNFIAEVLEELIKKLLGKNVFRFAGQDIKFSKKIPVVKFPNATDEIFKKELRPKMIQPVYVTDHPVEISPLAKSKDGSSKIADRFQLIVGGVELVNGFSELNDPLEQRKRLEEQENLRKKENKEAHPMDEEFIEMLEYGMPPAAGLAVSIDRLTMLLTDTHNIKEVILFPTMKPR